MAGLGPRTPAFIRNILPHGFESFQIAFSPGLEGIDLAAMANEVGEVLAGSDAVVSCLGVFGNPLGDRPEDAVSRAAWETCIDNAHLFGADMVAGFAGRVRGKSIPDSMPRFKEVWGPLARRAADKGVRIAFENCSMEGDWNSGDWNVAHCPAAWELMFNAVEGDHLGLEWEPCHQMILLIDPLPQLRKWISRVFHVHGKDASIHWDVIREHGIHSGKTYAHHRTPGFGDSNWTDIISELRRLGYQGSIDIEGYHDPVYVKEWEMTGQVYALNYLKQCRGGDFVPNPPELSA